MESYVRWSSSATLSAILSADNSSPILTALDEKPRRPFVRAAHRRVGDGGVAALVPTRTARERAVAA